MLKKLSKTDWFVITIVAALLFGGATLQYKREQEEIRLAKLKRELNEFVERYRSDSYESHGAPEHIAEYHMAHLEPRSIQSPQQVIFERAMTSKAAAEFFTAILPARVKWDLTVKIPMQMAQNAHALRQMQIGNEEFVREFNRQHNDR